MDLASDDLTGRQKLTILKYVSLDKEISKIGSHRFSAATKDSIPLKPVREWIDSHWKDEFIYDLSSRNVPITFRTALALALFTTRITEHLEGIDNIEIYGSSEVRKTFKNHNIPGPEGLEQVSYSKLPRELKNELVIPLIDQVDQATRVSKADLLFPRGVDGNALMMADYSFLLPFAMRSEEESDIINFNQINNLDYQAAAAGIALKNYLAVKNWEGLIERDKKAEKTQVTKEGLIEEPVRWEEPMPQDIHYDPGTSFLQVFPYHEGETADDLIRAFKRLTGGLPYQGWVDEPHHGEYFYIHLNPVGRLIGIYGSSRDWGDEDETDQQEIDLLSDRFEYEYPERNRRKTIMSLVSELRDELDTNKRALTEAETNYGRNWFIVEKGFIEALTLKEYPEATKAQREEDKELAKEAEKTVGIFNKKEEETTTNLVISEQSVDLETVRLDQTILMAIKKHSNLSMADFFSLEAGTYIRDNIGDWFESCSTLLSKYRGVLVDTTGFFSTLGITPTNDSMLVKRAYWKIAFASHPDRISTLSPEEQLEAIERFKNATEAYENLEDRLKQVNPDTFSPTYYLGRISKLFDQKIQLNSL